MHLPPEVWPHVLSYRHRWLDAAPGPQLLQQVSSILGCVILPWFKQKILLKSSEQAQSQMNLFAKVLENMQRESLCKLKYDTPVKVYRNFKPSYYDEKVSFTDKFFMHTFPQDAPEGCTYISSLSLLLIP